MLDLSLTYDQTVSKSPYNPLYITNFNILYLAKIALFSVSLCVCPCVSLKV